jgi:hypothetical protein
MAIRDDGSYPRMDNLLHEAPTRDAKGDDALPLGVLLPRPTTSDEPHVIKMCGLVWRARMSATCLCRCIRALVRCRRCYDDVARGA